MTPTDTFLSPRKMPLQARSEHTIEVLFEATLQVLLRDGYGALTTTRIAERAGVSVGSLYQYFPNKQALLAAVIGRHLNQIAEAVEVACQQAAGSSAGDTAALLVDAFVDTKLARPSLSRALYQLPPDLGQDESVKQAIGRSISAIASLLTGVDEHRRNQVAMLTATCMIGPVQSLLSSEVPSAKTVQAIRDELKLLVGAYLSAVNQYPAIDS